MDSLSCPFLSNLAIICHPLTPLLRFPSLRVSSVQTQDKPRTTTTTIPPRKPPINPLTKPSPLPPAQTAAPSLQVTVLNALDNLINTFVDPPRRPSVDPRHVLSGNFAPVGELPPTPCRVVEGFLPPSLDGAYIRNGPNPQFLPRGPYHLFDGDGMLHAIRISGGRASLCSRYVKTYKYRIEREVGSPVIPNVFSGFSGLSASVARGASAAARFLAGQFNPANGIGLANTSIALIGGRLYALGESDLPYAIQIDPSSGEIHTIGRHDFGGKLAMSMTAHPKTDPETGETFGFRYGPIPPFLTYFTVGAGGEKRPDVPIFSMRSPSFLHDFAITKRYAIFNEMQIGMDPLGMVAGKSPVGADAGKVPRVGVLPRDAADESRMRWFEVPGFNMVHAINAWDEDGGETVVMVAPNILSVEHTIERTDLIHASIEKVRVDLKNGTVSRQPLSTRNLDFGVINPAFVGKKHKYAYAAVGDPMPKISGVVKLDISVSENDRRDCIVGSRHFGPGCYGGEPFFVAREPNNVSGEEDDGYIVTFVHNEKTGESRFLVMDAKSPDLDTVAVVELPHRVPYGFHGLFIKESDLHKYL